MELTVTGEDKGISEAYVAERVARLKRMFASEPDVNVRFDTAGDGTVVTGRSAADRRSASGARV